MNANAEAQPARTPQDTLERHSPNVDWGRMVRLGGLRRFAAAITLLNLAGHGFLGFETSWLHPFVALATAYPLEILLEWIDSRTTGRVPRWRTGGSVGYFDFLLPAHISAMAVSMLLYPGSRLTPVIFATAVAIASKAIFRIWMGNGSRHFLNPSNTGIALTLILFPWVGIAPPYQFTENTAGLWDWLIPSVIIASGTFLNFRFTRRLPLLGAWLLGFALQAAVRHFLLDASLIPSLAPMTGMAFLLFTFYMITDPPTTPSSTRGQVVFGLSVAGAYGLLMTVHIVFGLFFSLALVCSVRGLALWLLGLRREAPSAVNTLTMAPESPAGQHAS